MARTIRDESSEAPGVPFDNVIVLDVRPKAMQVEIDGDPHWIPHSCVHDDSDLYVDAKGQLHGAPGTLTLKAWFARQEGLA